MNKMNNTEQEFLGTDSSGSGFQILSDDGTPEMDTMMQTKLKGYMEDNQATLGRIRQYVDKTMQ